MTTPTNPQPSTMPDEASEPGATYKWALERCSLKASELIKRLQCEIDKRGDLPVIYNMNGVGATVFQVLPRQKYERRPQIELTGDFLK